MIVTAFIAGPVSQCALPARHRHSLAILNQSNATLWVAFDQPAVAGQVAGQLTIGPLNPSGNAVDTPGAVFSGQAPWNAIHIIASAAGAPVTILE